MTLFTGLSKKTTSIVIFYIYEIEISRGGKEDAIEKSKLYVTF